MDRGEDEGVRQQAERCWKLAAAASKMTAQLRDWVTARLRECMTAGMRGSLALQTSPLGLGRCLGCG